THSAIEFLRRHVSFYGAANHAPQYQDMLQDADGTVFVHYLNAAFAAYPDGGIFFEVLEKHRDAVVSNLQRFRGVPGVRSKFEWAARYHNFVCSEFTATHNEPEVAEHIIPEGEFVVSPQRLDLKSLRKG